MGSHDKGTLSPRPVSGDECPTHTAGNRGQPITECNRGQPGDRGTIPRPSPTTAHDQSARASLRNVVANDSRGNRLRTRQAHRRAGGREARRRDRPAQPLAPTAGAGAAAPRDHAEEHPDDRPDRRGQDRDRAAPGPACRRAVRQGRGDQVHRGRLCRARRRHDHPRPGRSRHQGDAREGDAQGSRPRRRRCRGASARRAAAAGARGELHRHEAGRLVHSPEIPQDAARRRARRPRSRDRGFRACPRRWRSWRRREWRN